MVLECSLNIHFIFQLSNQNINGNIELINEYAYF